MRFAFLGIDDQTLAVAKAAVAEGRHTIVWTWGQGDEYRQVRQLAPRAKDATEWETLLADSGADAVVVAHNPDQELLAEQLRKLVQAGVPLLIAHPALDSMLIAYEIEMNRSGGKPVIVPLLPWRAHPAVNVVLGLFQSQPDGPMADSEQIVFERMMSDRGKRAVTLQFARDADLLRYLCGDVTRISTHGVPDPEAAYSNLSIEMSAVLAPGPVRWNVRPPSGRPGARLSVIGDQRQLTLDMPAEDSVWRVTVARAGQPETVADFRMSPGQVALDTLQTALDTGESPWPWTAAARAIEMSETIERCLRRGRTVELRDEEYSEASTFKGTMTSLGCGLLLGTLALIFAVMVLKTVLEMLGLQAAVDFLSGWPKVLLVALCLFLALQGLLTLARGSEETKLPDQAETDGPERKS